MTLTPVWKPILDVNKAARHQGHRIVVTVYTDSDGTALNLAIECEDCWAVIVDADLEPQGAPA